MIVWALLAGIAAGVSMIAWRPPARVLAGARGLARPATSWTVYSVERSSTRTSRASLRWKIIVPGLAVLGVLVFAQSPAHALIGAALLVAAGTGFGLWSMRRVQATRDARRKFVGVALESLADGLRAGLTPAAAVAQVDESGDRLLAPVRAAITMGGDVPDALRHAARRPGAEALDAVGAAWQIAERCGAPLAEVLDSLTENATHERELQRQVASGVGPARATAQLMAFLPLFGVVVGRGLGTDPIAIITGTTIGAACLFMGVCLACAGLWWVERIAMGAQHA